MNAVDEERKFKCEACGAKPGEVCRTTKPHISSRRRRGSRTGSHKSRLDQLRTEKLRAQGLKLLPERIVRTNL